MLLIDTLGLSCPMPLLLLKKALKQHPEQTSFHLISSDPNSATDLGRYCELHQLSFQIDDKQTHSDQFHYFIQRIATH